MPATVQPEEFFYFDPATDEEYPGHVSATTIKSKLILNKTLTKNASDNQRRESLMKLVKELKKETYVIKQKLSNVHDVYEKIALFNLGYIVKLINMTYENFINVYKDINVNTGQWDALELVSNFEKMKNAGHQLSDMMNILENMLPVKLRSTLLAKAPRKFKKEDKSPLWDIAWSYYDDGIDLQ